eukprot:9150060-Karenia_brevis.AAC.1
MAASKLITLEPMPFADAALPRDGKGRIEADRINDIDVYCFLPTEHGCVEANNIRANAASPMLLFPDTDVAELKLITSTILM